MKIPDFSLKGKVALVTGASRGIGEAIARAYAANGAKVVLASRKQEVLDQVAAEIKAAGGEALALAAHTGKLEQIESLFEKVTAAYGRVDILVNNAATNPFFGRVIDISESQYDKTFEVNTKGYFFMARRAAHLMIEQGQGGCIINIASIAGMTAPPMQGVYGMTKAAVIMMTKAFARELAGEQIRVNAICPGMTRTHMTGVFRENPDFYQMALDLIPMKRDAIPEEMVGAALYLASDAASFTTGSILVVDGGYIA